LKQHQKINIQISAQSYTQPPFSRRSQPKSKYNTSTRRRSFSRRRQYNIIIIIDIFTELQHHRLKSNNSTSSTIIDDSTDHQTPDKSQTKQKPIINGMENFFPTNQTTEPEPHDDRKAMAPMQNKPANALSIGQFTLRR
jgi:hypothetical protein